MSQNTDRIAFDAKGVLHIVDDEAGRAFCAEPIKMAPDGMTGPWCPLCVCRAAARAIFMGYTDQWHSEILCAVADQMEEADGT